MMNSKRWVKVKAASVLSSSGKLSPWYTDELSRLKCIPPNEYCLIKDKQETLLQCLKSLHEVACLSHVIFVASNNLDSNEII